MFYTIYRITNRISGKQYIGKHQTEDLDDGYMGSGKRITQAIAKYGIESFKKEILYVLSTEQEMNAKEAELVTEEFCLREDTYNLCVGGGGGFTYVNREGLGLLRNKTPEGQRRTIEALRANRRRWVKSQEFREHHRHLTQQNAERNKGRQGTFTGKSHTDESKRLIGEANKQMVGRKNSQYGTRWITDGTINRKISSDALLPTGWRPGRVTNQTRV